MELLTYRYRSLTVLVLVIVAQVLLLGYQIRSQQDVRLVRLWAVTAVTPVARLLETGRRSATSLLDRYVLLVGAQRENEKLRSELGELKQEARFLRSELATAERAEALQAFRERTPSKTVAARIIGAGTGSGSRALFIDRGSRDGVAAGMAVMTPDGVVGKITAAYPIASRVVLITDPQFAAGVVSRKNAVQGTIIGQADGLCRVEYVQNEETVEEGEWFFTSGDDRTFPRGLPVGQVISAEKGLILKEIVLAPSGLSGGLEEVLVVIEGIHQPVPEPPAVVVEAPMLPLPPAVTEPPVAGQTVEPREPTPRLTTDVDRLMQRYRTLGEAQGHTFGEGGPGSTPPDFNLDRRPPPSESPEGSTAEQAVVPPEIEPGSAPWR
jgi:rod shape-determining protein MreC